MNNYFTFCLFSAFFFFSCKGNNHNSFEKEKTSQTTDSSGYRNEVTREKVGQFLVNLRNDHGKCILVYSGPDFSKEIPTLVGWPANFHKNLEQKVREVIFKDTLYFIVEKSTKDSIRANSCITHVQSFKISNQEVIASEKMSTLAACPPFQWDDYLFYSLFDKKE